MFFSADAAQEKEKVLLSAGVYKSAAHTIQIVRTNDVHWTGVNPGPNPMS
jgi:hypothetical protein